MPPRPPGDNWRLKLAVRLRMKVLYRPRGLDGSPERAIARLRWQLRPGERGAGPTLEARNDSPYFVSLAEVALAGTPSPLRLGGLTVPPFGSAPPLPQGIEALPPGTPLRYRAAGDGGEAIHGEAEIARTARPRHEQGALDFAARPIGGGLQPSSGPPWARMPALPKSG